MAEDKGIAVYRGVVGTLAVVAAVVTAYTQSWIPLVAMFVLLGCFHVVRPRET